jgi:GNAT superfamily N-acetyltransferase
MGTELGELFIGLSSAAIAALAASLWQRIKRQRHRKAALKRYPINGYYASSYTDELRGVKRTIRDEVHIEQHGLDFRGMSRNLESGRQFRFQGRIVGDRYLTGTYGGEHRADDANGMFFMALDLLNDGHVQGIWAGYGAEAGTVLSGTWNWRKLLDVKISECSPSDPRLPAASSLFNDALGSGFITVDSLEMLCSSPNGLVLVASGTHDELIGAATAYVLDEADKTDLEAKLLAADVRRPNIVGNKVGMLKSSAVVPAAAGRGVGLRLVNERLRYLHNLGCSMVVVLAWDSGTRHSSLGVLEAAGFSQVANLPEYWREPEGQETFDCIRCGRPCVCTAIVMRRSLYDLMAAAEPRKKGRLGGLIGK